MDYNIKNFCDINSKYMYSFVCVCVCVLTLGHTYHRRSSCPHHLGHYRWHKSYSPYTASCRTQSWAPSPASGLCKLDGLQQPKSRYNTWRTAIIHRIQRIINNTRYIFYIHIYLLLVMHVFTLLYPIPIPLSLLPSQIFQNFSPVLHWDLLL